MFSWPNYHLKIPWTITVTVTEKVIGTYRACIKKLEHKKCSSEVRLIHITMKDTDTQGTAKKQKHNAAAMFSTTSIPKIVTY